MSTMEGGARSFSRRSFVKAAGAGALGLAGAGAMASTGAWLGPADAQDVADEHVAYTYHNEHCLCNCMLKCTVRDGRLCMIEPRPNEDKRFQNVCLKGISEIQHIYGEARLQSPMKRVGERGSGEFEVISWDEAFQTIAEAFKQCQDAYGKDALWIQYSTEAQQRFTPLLASLLGAQAGGMNGYDMGQGNGQGQAFGWDGMFAKNTIWEWPQAKTVLMVNCNVVETGMMWSRAFLDAMDAGTRIICFDPRFSATAAKASEWVPLNPGTDPALFLGFANHILENDLFDREHVLANTALPFLVDAETGQSVGEPRTFVDPASGKESPSVHFLVWDTVSNSARPYDEAGVVPALEGEFTVDGRACTTQFTRLRAEMAEYTPEWAEGVTGVPAADIARIAEEYAAGPSIICNGVGGIDKYGNNDVAGHAYALVASLTGNYGKRGTGCGIYCYHVTPYNATLGAWPLPEGAKTTPSTMGFYDIVQKPNNVHAAFFFGDIPTQKAANWNKTRAWLESLDFVALADIYHSSVADYVDLVLPVCSKFECADEVGGIKCANAHILENQKVIDPLFESKSDFYIEKGIAEAMGLGQYYPENGEEFARALLDSDDPLMAGIDLRAPGRRGRRRAPERHREPARARGRHVLRHAVRQAGAVLREPPGVRPGIPALGGAARGLRGQSAAREVPALVHPEPLALPRALHVHGRGVDPAAVRAAHRAQPDRRRGARPGGRCEGGGVQRPRQFHDGAAPERVHPAGQRLHGGELLCERARRHHDAERLERHAERARLRAAVRPHDSLQRHPDRDQEGG